jgi:hypothetical protein
MVRLAMTGARSLDTDIAVQRCATANAAAWQSVSQFALITRSDEARASLLYRMCYHFPVCFSSPDQSSPIERSQK